MRDTKVGVAYDIADPSKRRQLPQHDFNEAKVNQTPASFRFIKGHIEKVAGIGNDDQTVVIIRPKYYNGSSGRVWASDYLRQCHEHLSQIQESGLHAYSNGMKKFASYLHDILFYFVDLTMKEDVLSAPSQPKCQHIERYEEEKTEWLVLRTEEDVLSWSEMRDGIPNSERDIGSKPEHSTIEIQKKATFCLENCCLSIKNRKLWEKLEDISKDSSEVLGKIIPGYSSPPCVVMCLKLLTQGHWCWSVKHRSPF